MDEPERLQKVLARAGLGSRRTIEQLITQGRILVNGTPARLGQRIHPNTDSVHLDNAPVTLRTDLVTYLLNKPTGMLTTAHDPHGRPTVLDTLPPQPRVHPVGRLDADTEGLLLLTNDGALTHRLTHPSHGVEKEYLAHVHGRPSRGALRQLREGIDLEDGPATAVRASLLGPSTLRIVLHEGRNRQVRRMCAAVGHPVQRLARIRIGPLRDRTLQPGDWRLLTRRELRALERAATPPATPQAPQAPQDDPTPTNPPPPNPPTRSVG